MAIPASISYSQLGSGTPSHADLLRSFVAYKDLFHSLDRCPEGDVRHRFSRIRAIRAKYVERLVKSQERAWNDLEEDVMSGKVNPEDEECKNRLVRIMHTTDEALHWYSRIYEDDSKSAAAPVVNRYFMDMVPRWYMEKAGIGLRAPNGELRSTYGSTGDQVPGDLMTVRDCDTGFFQCLILDHLSEPFNQHIFVPLYRCYNTLLGRDPELGEQFLGGRTLDIIAYSLECIVGVCCFEAAVVLVYNLGSTKSRLVAVPFASLACAIPVVFLSEKARGVFVLISGIWAVLIVIVFLSANNMNTKAG